MEVHPSPGKRAGQVTFPARLSLGKEITLQGDLCAALCLRQPYQGEIVTITDAAGTAFRGRIVELTADQARVFIFEQMREPLEPSFDLVLLQALPEKERMELIIQKTTELGVNCICPFKSSRSISLDEREASQPKAHRWQQIALKAAKQSRRASVPAVLPYCSFVQALGLARSLELKIMLWEKEGQRLASLIRGMPLPKGIALLIGPEGGWAEEEVQQAWAEGFFSVSLGGRILRTETAAIAACAIIQYEWGGI
jgi:16S rRNA (uracil1498-N3)-methyltransferase